VRVAVPWSGCVPSLKVYQLDASLSRDVWWEDHLSLEI